MNNLEKYGASPRHFSEAGMYPGLYLARVVSQYGGLYKIVTEEGECLAEVSGKMRHAAVCMADYPAVGDFVMADRQTDAGGNAVMQQLLRRKSLFERAAAGTSGQTQVVAANIDIVFVCMALNSDYNLSRLERYISVGWNSGATPVAVLTKADLCQNLEAAVAEIEGAAPGVDVVPTFGLEETAGDALLQYLKQGVTAAFMGSSGVGKTTLINRMAGMALATAETRQDDKGRHTTTRRELLPLPCGGVVIDTPGMRELGLEGADLAKGFADIEALMQQCKFSDCTHTSEPGCAVLAAVENGKLDARRLENYHKLQKEAKYEGLNARQIEAAKINSMFGGINEMKQLRDHVKKKNKR